MSERLPLPAELLRGHAKAGQHDDAEIIRLMRLGDRGDYLEAAHEAASLLETSSGDVRLTAVFLVGSFVERGPAGLPELLDCVDRQFRPSAGEPPELARIRESSLTWLCRSLTSQIAFHTVRRSETWERWLTEVGPEQPQQIAEMSAKLMACFPTSAAALAQIGRWSTEKLAPASARVRKTAAVEAAPAQPLPDPKLAEPSWDAPDEPESDEAEFASDDDSYELDMSHVDPRAVGFTPTSFGLPTPRHIQEPLEFGSPALSALIEKLQGFEILVERGELDKAAIIASDIQSVIERFDPLTYLPGLFGRYLQLLSKIIAEVEARWNAGDSAARRVLEQFYRADLDRFINE